jgi:hypothetical protein
MSDKLKPCPFCGNHLVERHNGWFDHQKGKCILSGKAFPKGYIGQWNNRALPQPTDAELDAAALARPVVRALVEALERIAHASDFYGVEANAEDQGAGTLAYAHKSTCNLARAALVAAKCSTP